MIHRDVEKPLQLRHMQIHAQHAVGAGGGDEICHQFGGDRIAGFGFAILAGIPEVGRSPP